MDCLIYEAAVESDGHLLELWGRSRHRYSLIKERSGEIVAASVSECQRKMSEACWAQTVDKMNDGGGDGRDKREGTNRAPNGGSNHQHL